MDPVTAEKVAARRRYGRVHHLHTAFRCVEAFAAVCLLSWSSARLPSLARLSADLLRRLVAALLAPRFVFLLGNAIVLTLFAMSCRRSVPSGGGDIYDQFLACQRRAIQSRPPPPPPEKAEEPPVRREKAGRAYRRSRSERAKRRRVEPDLRRSASELSRDEAAAEAEKAALEESKEEDAEEFRQMVESFIATQLKRFHREESMDVGAVPHLLRR